MIAHKEKPSYMWRLKLWGWHKSAYHIWKEYPSTNILVKHVIATMTTCMDSFWTLLPSNAVPTAHTHARTYPQRRKPVTDSYRYPSLCYKAITLVSWAHPRPWSGQHSCVAFGHTLSCSLACIRGEKGTNITFITRRKKLIMLFFWSRDKNKPLPF